MSYARPGARHCCRRALGLKVLPGEKNVAVELAGELLRVLRRPGGVILWYDFWLNPTNHQTRGIRPAEIRRLFPGCRFACRRVTLAPPLARRLGPVSWTLGSLLEQVGLLNSHYLAAIRPRGE
jgi:hypothetical protein